MKEIMELLFSGHHGIYIPQAFAEQFNPENSYWVYDLEDAAILREGPDHEFYWETWQDVLDNAYWQENAEGPKYHLRQDDDLWAILEGWSYNDHGDLENDETGEVYEP